MLEIGVPENQVRDLPTILKTSANDVEQMMQRLAPILISGGTAVRFSQEEIEKKFAELMRMALTTSSNPEVLLTKRKEMNVFVSDFSRAGLVICQALAAVGVGTIFSDDAKHVSRSDTQLLGHPTSSLGLHRSVSVKQVVGPEARIEVHTRLTDPIYERTDFAILMASDVLSPERYQTFLSRDVPHISIVFNEKGVRVSPIIFPGATACLGCAEIEKISLDPSWISLALQLAQSPRNLSDTTSLLFAAAMATRACIASGVGNLQSNPHDENLGHELNLATGEIVSFQHANLNCGCREA
ncbi:MAG: hypothetical protein RLZZ579_741 [Actinomycetota bacterium]|jgi:hypothetical protein